MKNITISEKQIDVIGEKIGALFLTAAHPMGMGWNYDTAVELGYTLLFCEVDHLKYPLDAAITERNMFVHQLRVNGIPAAHALSILNLDVVDPSLELLNIGFGTLAPAIEAGLDWFASNAPVTSPIALLRAPGRGAYALYKFDEVAPLVLPILTPPGFGLNVMTPCTKDKFIAALNTMPSSATPPFERKKL